MRNAFLLMVLLGFGSTAMAADNGIYVGGSLGQANVEIDEIGDIPIDIDGDDTGFKVIAGIRPLDWLGIEANYVNFGEVEDNGFEIDADGISAFAVGFLAVGPVDLFAKGGLISWDSSISREGFTGERSDDGTDFAYGVGAQFRVWSLAVRAEYELFDVDDADELNMISVGLTFTFL
jgi:opacity protein-like surface antigen